MDIASRLIQFRDYCNLTNSEFCIRTGIPRPTLSQFLSGRNKRLSDNLAARIHEGFPCLNMMWLLFGEGDMLTDGNITVSEGKNGENVGLSVSENTETQSGKLPQRPSLFDQDSESIQKKSGHDDGLETFKREKRENPHAAGRNEESQETEAFAATVRANPSKTVNHIMVFYSDGSWDEFRPVRRQ